MGERKGVNKYYPPDYDPAKGGLNKWQGTHALRERARKLHLGILIIRFEMPYNIWCGGCGNHIGMGVRYNAEKSKTGMYYTTPIYKFRMKCHLCDNHFEIQTDPANLDYVILSGARRQEKRFDPAENGTVVPDERSKIQRLSTDGMFQLQHGSDDRCKLQQAAPTLHQLQRLQHRLQDDYAANSQLRKLHRINKRVDAESASRDAELLKKSSLNLSLVKESEEDRRLASLMSLQDAVGSERRQLECRAGILSRPVLGSVVTPGGGFSNYTTPSVAPTSARTSRLSIGVRTRRSNSTTPQPTTTAPQPNTTAPQPTTTAPQPNTTAPQPNTTAPQPTTTSPQPTTTAPQPNTTAPQPNITAPQPTTTAPQPNTTATGTNTTSAGSDTAICDVNTSTCEVNTLTCDANTSCGANTLNCGKKTETTTCCDVNPVADSDTVPTNTNPHACSPHIPVKPGILTAAEHGRTAGLGLVVDYSSTDSE